MHHMFPRLILIIIVALFSMLSSACSVKRADIPPPSALSLDEALAGYAGIKSVEAVMSIEFEKKDSIMSGDAALTVAPESMSLRVYYLGFLQGEVYEEDGEIRTKPRLSRERSAILVEGLKKGFFWWDIKDAERIETTETYVIANSGRMVILDKSTLLPKEQTIFLDNGEKLLISYDIPKRIDEKDSGSIPLWYPSHLVIKLRQYIVRADISSYTVAR